MAEYDIIFARSARKELESLGAPEVTRIIRSIEMLAKAPRPKSSRKLRGQNNLWRIRVGDYRVIYAVDDEADHIDITALYAIEEMPIDKERSYSSLSLVKCWTF